MTTPARATDDAQRMTRRVLSYREATAVLAPFGVELAPVAVVPATGALTGDLAVGFPAVVKLDDPRVPHRSDVGGVELGCQDVGDVLAARTSILARVRRHIPDYTTDALIVQHQVGGGVELSVGIHQDADFGPVISMGLGGVLVELIGQRAYRVPPLSLEVAESMLDEAVPAALVRGYRGDPPIDVDSVTRLLMAVGELALATRPTVLELDLNPVIVTDRGCTVVDCLVVVGGDPLA